MDDLNELLDKGVEKKDIFKYLDMTIHTLESRIKKENFTESELILLSKLNED